MGFDPGSHRMGVGVVEEDRGKATVANYCTYEPGKTKEQKDRYMGIFRHVKLMLEKWEPQAVGIEKVFVGRQPGNAIMTGECRGAIYAALGAWGREIFVRDFAPATVKKAATGNGRADKKEIRRALELQFGPMPGEDDGRDAVACALAALGTYRLDRAARSAIPSASMSRQGFPPPENPA